MVCVPALENEVVRLALPLLSETATGAPPSILKLTVPVGVPGPPFPATVAMKVTLAPTTDGLPLELREVEVLAGLIVSDSGVAVLEAKLLAPP